jgi:SAM-dependent methyltransferase
MKAPQHLSPGRSAQVEDLILHRRYRLVRQLSSQRGGRLLDFGCGNGAQTRLFAADHEELLGVDIAGAPVGELNAWAAAAGEAGRVRAEIYDGRCLPCADASMDAAISFEVLEHVADEAAALAELARVLKPGAVLAISVPNRWWIFETHGAQLPLLPWNRVPFFSWLPTRLHDRWARARIYRRRQIVAKLRAVGFEILAARYITAPMDVVPWPWLRAALRATAFRGDTTPFPWLATAVLVIARRPLGAVAAGSGPGGGAGR